jgi:hypothetical protein
MANAMASRPPSSLGKASTRATKSADEVGQSLDGKLEGHLYIHNSDDSPFKTERQRGAD